MAKETNMPDYVTIKLTRKQAIACESGWCPSFISQLTSRRGSLPIA